jgi:hypothetical protein
VFPQRPQPAFRHLASAGVARAQKKHSRWFCFHLELPSELLKNLSKMIDKTAVAEYPRGRAKERTRKAGVLQTAGMPIALTGGKSPSFSKV